MSQENRYFSWRIGAALAVAGASTLLLLSMILWWFFSIGQAWLTNLGLSILILPAVALLILGLCFLWFWLFLSLMVIFGAEKE